MFKSFRYEYSLCPYYEKENKQGRKMIRKNHRHKAKQLLNKEGIYTLETGYAI